MQAEEPSQDEEEEEEEAMAPLDGPSEAASNDEVEKEVEGVWRVFLRVIQEAMTITAIDVDKKMHDAQNLVMRVRLVARKSDCLEVVNWK